MVLHGQVVTGEVLETAFAEMKAPLNSRPFTEVSSDDSGLEENTPNHFLISRANPVLPRGVFSDKEISSKKRRQPQVVVDHIWSQWYLPALIETKKWNQCWRFGRRGENPRRNWPLACVTRTFPGKDDTIRVCEVKTKYGLYKKPVAKLALLE